MWKDGVVIAEACRLAIVPVGDHDKDRWYRLDLPRETPLAEFDAVLNRKDPPFDIEYIVGTWLLEHAERQGARVFNAPRAVRDHSEKLSIMQFTDFTVPTIVARLPEQIQKFIDANGDAIVKPLDGMGGQGIFRVTDRDPNRNAIVETVTAGGMRTIMAQRYIPEIRDGDKRVLVIGGKPVPYALARIPKSGETRGNLAAGGTGVARPLSARDRLIAETLGPELMRRGLLLVGLDVIGDYLTEVNVTSPTCIRELDAQFGLNIAGTLFDRIEARLAGSEPAR